MFPFPHSGRLTDAPAPRAHIVQNAIRKKDIGRFMIKGVKDDVYKSGVVLNWRVIALNL